MKKQVVTKEDIRRAFASIKHDICESYAKTSDGAKVVANTFAQIQVMNALLDAVELQTIEPMLVKIHVMDNCTIDEDLPIFPELVDEHKALVKKIMAL